MNRHLVATAAVSVLLLSACASQPSQPQAAVSAAADPAATLSQEDRIAFFTNAARNGRLEEVKQGLDSGIPVNAKDTLDQTALLAAATHNYLEVVQLLLERGADPNLPDNAGWTPLHYAAWFGSGTAILAVLQDHGAQVNAQNDRGITPLYFASVAGHDTQVKYLLAHGADRNIASKSGYTPLRAAKTKGLHEIVALLDPDAAKAAPPAPATKTQ